MKVIRWKCEKVTPRSYFKQMDCCYASIFHCSDQDGAAEGGQRQCSLRNSKYLICMPKITKRVQIDLMHYLSASACLPTMPTLTRTWMDFLLITTARRATHARSTVFGVWRLGSLELFVRQIPTRMRTMRGILAWRHSRSDGGDECLSNPDKSCEVLHYACLLH